MVVRSVLSPMMVTRAASVLHHKLPSMTTTSSSSYRVVLSLPLITARCWSSSTAASWTTKHSLVLRMPRVLPMASAAVLTTHNNYTTLGRPSASSSLVRRPLSLWGTAIPLGALSSPSPLPSSSPSSSLSSPLGAVATFSSRPPPGKSGAPKGGGRMGLGAGGLITGAAVLLGKGKYILGALKLTKFASLASMFVTIGAYSMIFGVPYAVGMVGLILIHECT